MEKTEAPKKINDGGPAFATSEPMRGISPQPGMSMRDYFAAKAMQGMAAADPCPIDKFLGSESTPIDLAVAAYRIADAMIEVRGLPRT